MSVKWIIIGSGNGLAPVRRQAIHCLNQCKLIVNCTLRNMFQSNLNQNTSIFCQNNTFGNVVWKTAAILFKPRCDNARAWHVSYCQAEHASRNKDIKPRSPDVKMTRDLKFDLCEGFKSNRNWHQLDSSKVFSIALKNVTKMYAQRSVSQRACRDFEYFTNTDHITPNVFFGQIAICP